MHAPLYEPSPDRDAWCLQSLQRDSGSNESQEGLLMCSFLVTTLVWHSVLRAEMPRRQGSEITALNEEPGLPALSKPEICLPDRCNSAAPSLAPGSGRTLLGESVDRHRRLGPLQLWM